MIERHKILGLIPARGGSKGIPRKNIRPLGGKPLIAWTTEEAKKSKYIDRLVVSTDDHEIADTARRWGADVPFIRPAELASDTARGIDVVLHALRELPDFDAVVLLQPTSPFRSVEDIDYGLEIWASTRGPVVGLTAASKSPYWMYQLSDDGRLTELLHKPERASNRQSLPQVYVINGAVYVGSCASLSEIRSFVTSETRGLQMPRHRSIDLDTEVDWDYAEWILTRKLPPEE